MIAIARILLVGKQSGDLASLKVALETSGFAAFLVSPNAVSDADVADVHPDVVLVDGRPDVDAALDVVTALRAHSEFQHLPAVLLVDERGRDQTKRALDVGIDDVLQFPIKVDVLVARITPLFRMATMQAELRRRAVTARAFGVHPDPLIRADESDDDPAAILMVGDVQGDAPVVRAVLGEVGQLTLEEDPYKAAERLQRSRYDAVVASIVDDGEDVLNLCGYIRRNPSLFNLPVLVIADQGKFPDQIEPYRRGASSVLDRNGHDSDFGGLDGESLYASVLTLVRRQRRRWRFRRALESTLQLGSKDEQTGLYNKDFIHNHLFQLLDSSERWERSLTVMMITIQNLNGIRREYGQGPGQQLVQQMGNWIGTLIRTEDIAALVEDDRFLVALPDTSLDNAHVVGSRITGVLLNTQFTVTGLDNEPEMGASIKAWVEAAYAERQDGDKADQLIERARESSHWH